MSFVLIGAGQHGRVAAEAHELAGQQMSGYIDPKPSSWLQAPQLEEADLEAGAVLVMGVGGTTTKALARRLALIERYLADGMAMPAVVHPAAWVSPRAGVESAATVLAKAVVQPAATIGLGAILNAGSIVEHDTVIGAGSHIAPGAIVLGDCEIGRCCMIGAGAVVLPGSEVPDGLLIKAATRWPQ